MIFTYRELLFNTYQTFFGDSNLKLLHLSGIIASQPTQYNISINRSNNVVYSSSIQTVESVVQEKVVRRSANWKPNFWDFDSLTSLASEYKEDIYKEKADELQEKIRQALNDSVGSLGNLDFIDAVQRLGLGHYYKEEIKRALDNEFINYNQSFDDDLYTTSLRFRLLRQHGYDVPQDVFQKYKDDLKMCLCDDVKGMLSLYEASYLGVEGEDLMDEVKALTTKQLKALMGNTEISPTLAKKIAHSLEIPLHWRTPKLEARWYIDIYEGEHNMVPMLLDLAKLKYNIDQATYQSEIGNLTRWWIDLDLHNKLDFCRDRILEHLYWSVEMIPEQPYGRFREGLTPLTSLITVTDDVYDIYGTLEELEVFTNVVERWDASAMQTLPQPMKICFMAMLNSTNEIGYKILKEDGYDVIPHQKKAWVDLCKAYLKEAKWFYSGYTPTLKEYLENAVVSIGTPLMLINSYLLTAEKITKEAIDYIESMPSLIYSSALLVRLANDLGTSSDEIARGDNPKSIQCYMHETGASEEAAREHIKELISEIWKKMMNKDQVASYEFLEEPFISSAANLGRQALCMYQYGDGHGIPDQETKDRIKTLFMEPIQLQKAL
ncbi:Alpha-terpineol synthase protein [Thalictrum thalictroides]|uniref:Alpha-terpineol synthase protein n=1 Tax=Thalictrum thalictroides TaxID=46969 RepID=A0A7J6V127_THATH|nr:Alpha-terpineol synthase protein [Thalictrum thalictroides]